MGNLFCYNKKFEQKSFDEEESYENQLKKEISKMNKEFVQKYLDDQSDSINCFKDFHQVLHLKYYYFLKNILRNSIEHSKIYFCDPIKFQNKEDAFGFIKKNIIENNNNLFYIIINKYEEFLKLLFLQDDENINYGTGISQAVSSQTTGYTYQQSQQINHSGQSLSIKNAAEFLQTLNFIQNFKYQIVFLVINQINFLFLILRQLIIFPYLEVIKQLFQHDEIVDRELFCQQIIQHYIFSNASPLNNLFQPLLVKYYQEQKTFICTLQEEPKLDNKLLPKNNNYPLESSFYLNYSSLGEDNDKQKEYIEQTLNKEEYKEIPYSQTFYYLIQIIQTSKLWKKFKLIEKLNKTIISTYMYQRTDSQKNKLMDTIYAEDSQAEILLYILQKFYQAHCHLDLQQNLLYSLKFMNDFDGILHQDIKYLYCPSFIRFFVILEMLISYNQRNN